MGFDFGKFLFGSDDEVTAPYQTPEAAEWKGLLADYSKQALGAYNPTHGMQSNQNAFNKYNEQMGGVMNGQLGQGFTDKLGSIRDNNIQLAQNQIGQAANGQVGGLLNSLAGRGVINSSVMSDSAGQIGKSAANAMSDATLRENNNYNQGYMNSLGLIGNLANQNLGNAFNYSNTMQQQALSPMQHLYGIEQSLQPTIKKGSSGLLGNLVGGFSQGVGSGLGGMIPGLFK